MRKTIYLKIIYIYIYIYIYSTTIEGTQQVFFSNLQRIKINVLPLHRQFETNKKY